MLGNTRKRTLAYISLGSFAIALAGVGAALALSPSAGDPRVPAASSASPDLNSNASERFSVFSQAPGNSQDISLVAEVVRGLHVDLDPSSVRLAEDTGDLQVRVAGDSQSVCLTLRMPGKAIVGSCAPETNAATPATPLIQTTGYPSGEISEDGQLAGAALFPNGTTNVTVTSTDGDASPIKITNNTVAFVADKTDTLSWTGPDGQTYSSLLPH